MGLQEIGIVIIILFVGAFFFIRPDLAYYYLVLRLKEKGKEELLKFLISSTRFFGLLFMIFALFMAYMFNR